MYSRLNTLYFKRIKGVKIDMEDSAKNKHKSFRYNETVTRIPVKHNCPFEISHYGITYSDSDYHQIRLSSKLTAIEYVLSGSGTIIIDGSSYSVNKGDTYILVQGKNQNYYSSSDNPLEKIWFNCTGQLAIELLKLYGLSDRVVFHNVYSYPYIEKMHKIMSENSDSSLNKASLLYHEIIQFLSKTTSADESVLTPVNSIRNYIDCHISENIKISDIAEFLSYSPDHIIRIFKATHGITPHQYIINSKMQIAAALLRSTKKPIKEISDELNYAEVHHFSALFEKTLGVRPSVYRKQYMRIRTEDVFI